MVCLFLLIVSFLLFKFESLSAHLMLWPISAQQRYPTASTRIESQEGVCENFQLDSLVEYRVYCTGEQDLECHRGYREMSNREQRNVVEQSLVSNRAILTLAIFCALVGALLFGSYAHAGYRTSAATTAGTAKTEHVVIAIEGMSCDNCAKGIKAMLKRTAGVISAEVSFERREAQVDYDTERTTREKILEVVNNMGYKASTKE